MNLKHTYILLLPFAVIILCSGKKKEKNNIAKEVCKSFQYKYGKDRVFVNFKKVNSWALRLDTPKEAIYKGRFLYIINQNCPESGEMHSVLWNTTDTINYNNGYSKIEFAKEMYFPKNYLAKVEKWDTVEFRKLHDLVIFDACSLYISRVYFNKGRLMCDCFEIYAPKEWSDNYKAMKH